MTEAAQVEGETEPTSDEASTSLSSSERLERLRQPEWERASIHERVQAYQVWLGSVNQAAKKVLLDGIDDGDVLAAGLWLIGQELQGIKGATS